MPFFADNPGPVVVTIIETFSHSYIHSIGIVGYSTTMASSSISHLIYCCIQYILNSIVVILLVRVARLPSSAPVPTNGNSNMPVTLNIHCPTHIHLALLHHNVTHLFWFPRFIRITRIGPEET